MRSSGGTDSIRLLFLLNQAIGMRGRVAQTENLWYPRLELDPLLRANSSGKWMFYLGHFRHEIRRFDQLRWRVTASNDDVQRGLRRANRAKLLQHLINR